MHNSILINMSFTLFIFCISLFLWSTPNCFLMYYISSDIIYDKSVNFERTYYIFTWVKEQTSVLDPDILHDIDLINIDGSIISISASLADFG